MGLDTVELVMEIEDEFEIAIPDEDAEHIQTCGDLHAYVLGRLRPAAAQPCPSAAAFYRLRRALLRHLPIPRDRIRPGARIHLLTGDAHAHRWPDIARDIGLDGAYSFNGSVSIYPPAAYTTLANLAKRMAFPQWSDRPVPQDDLATQTWQTIRNIVSEQFGVNADQIHPETHFINDLGAD